MSSLALEEVGFMALMVLGLLLLQAFFVFAAYKILRWLNHGRPRRDLDVLPARPLGARAATKAPDVPLAPPPPTGMDEDFPEGPPDRTTLGRSFRHGPLVANVVGYSSESNSYGPGESSSRKRSELTIRPRPGKPGWIKLRFHSAYSASDRSDSSSEGASLELAPGEKGELISVSDYEKYNHAMDHDRRPSSEPVVQYLREELGWTEVDREAFDAFVRAALDATMRSG